MKTLIKFSASLILTLFTVITVSAHDIGNLYVFVSDANGFDTKTVFYDDGKEVVAFDAQFTEAKAKQAIDFLKTKTANPVKYLVVTHPNPDKFNGIPAFQAIGAKVVMSNLSIKNLPEVHNYKKYYFVQTAKMFTEETYPKLPTADITFEDNYVIKLANGGEVELTELKQSGISTNQTVAYVKTVNALILGDLVHHNAHAWLEGPIVKGTASYNGDNGIRTL
jgi:glyoxylase-like metal-dependent hydrolase (beta-lactamase superfamily II)